MVVVAVGGLVLLVVGGTVVLVAGRVDVVVGAIWPAREGQETRPITRVKARAVARITRQTTL